MHLAHPVVGLGQRRLDRVRAPVLEGRLAEHLVELELLEEQELQLAKVGVVTVDGGNRLAHGGVS